MQNQADCTRRKRAVIIGRIFLEDFFTVETFTILKPLEKPLLSGIKNGYMLLFDEMGNGFSSLCSIAIFHTIGLLLTILIFIQQNPTYNGDWPATSLKILPFVPQIFPDQLIILIGVIESMFRF